VKPLFDDALVVGNFETVLAGDKRGFAGYPMFNTPDELADALVDLGVNIVTLATNHILDKGPSGAERTAQTREDAGIKWTGLGVGGVGPNEPLVVEYAGLRWAFVNYAYGSNTPIPSSDDGAEGIHLNVISDDAIKEGLARDASPDITAACFHWGNEYQFTPTKRQRDAAALSIAEGADLVIGTHPHVLQPIEIGSSDHGYNLTAYSLGNFVSFQRTPPRERSLILAVDVQKNDCERARISRVSVAPTRVAATRPSGGRRVEVVYAGGGKRFNHSALPAGELKTARAAGRAVLEFVGVADGSEPDEEGFYTLWSADYPDALPKARRKTPDW
jgi:poly-gamma-glutamate synthesis protein (capsule biosynthesis protein)